MSVTVADTRPSANQRLLDELRQTNRKPLLLDGETALSKSLTDLQKSWLLEYVSNRWTTCFSSLSGWREKLTMYERMADEDFSDRISAPDQSTTDATRSIFERQNHTLGLVSGACDTVYARAKDDIFGVRPWLAATPQGQDDNDLSDVISKHSQWKFDQSNLEEALIDSLKIATDLGTAFVKPRWMKTIETSETLEDVLFSISGDAPLLDETGDYVRDESKVPEGTDPRDLEWREMLVKNERETYNNIDAAVLDFKEVAFDATAPKLDLQYTDFMHRFRIGLLDILNEFEFSEEKKNQLKELVFHGEDQEARDHRGETNPEKIDSMSTETAANPIIQLVEGFVRCDPTESGNPIRIHCIYAPDLHIMFHLDYLVNFTPDGILPVFPVRCFKQPRRIVGMGYWEKFQKTNNAIDGFYNAVTLRNRQSIDVVKAWHRSALRDESEGHDFQNSPDKLWELKEDKTIDDLISFKVVPDASGGTIQLMEQMLQMAQLRIGTASASQGDLVGVPQSDTATGSKIIAGQGQALVKCPVEQMMGDVEKPTEFCVHLNYANLDREETFTWGEGRDAELLKITPGDVNGLRMNVTMTLTQSQSLQKLEAAKTAIEIGTDYTQLPEPEKNAQRRLYIQALSSLGFNDADQIIREGVVSAEEIMALLPDDVAEVFAAWLESQGAGLPADGGTPADVAPVTE